MEDIIGRTDYDLYPLELAKKYRADDQRVIESGEMFETMEEHTPLNGETTTVRVIKAPMLDASGQIKGTLIIFWDSNSV